ncbi:MAG: hypothetical protein KatS3mg043_1780 [Rhodothermaceae bacterium]|nr:MAG: hypothetical protein KatS3mg043_1780 [Rhodothermaceae bacterium]
MEVQQPDAARDPYGTPFVTAIVPVYNQADRLARCLAALAAQTYPRDRYEVVVVDNGSSEDIRSVVVRWEGMRYAFEGQPGSYAARNRGVALANGTVLAFTDADCLPVPGWLAAGVDALRMHPGCGLVGGHIEVCDPEDRRQDCVAWFESLTAFNQERYISVHRFAGAGNLFTWKDIFARVGGFDATLFSGGDQEWGRRVWNAGYTLHYAPEAIVVHPPRGSLVELCRRELQYTGGEYLLRQRAGGYPMGAWLADVGRDLRPRVRLYRKMYMDGRLKGPGELARFVLMTCLLGWVRAAERVRLRLGGVPRRN